MNRLPEETFLNFCFRVTQALRNKEINYSEWAKLIIGDTNYGDETLRRVSIVFEQFLERLFVEGISNVSDQEVLEEIKRLKLETAKERKKLQTENLEYQSHLRTQARGEMFSEKILEAIECLPKFDMKPVKFHKHTEKSVGVLCIADAHYGSQIELKSLFNETVNVYNPDIFKLRMKLLSGRIIDDYKRLNYDKLIVFDLGDCVENILRMSSLQKLQMGVLDAVIEYSEIITSWLIELYNLLRIPIQYSLVGGNHDQLRLLSSKKDFPEENLAKVVAEFVKLRIETNDFDELISITPYAECHFEELFGENILVYHGDDAKSEKEEMAFWENYNDVDIDLLIMGHNHNKTEKAIGYGMYGDKEVIRVPSLVGPDQYAKKIRKISRAGAKFILFEENYGKTLETTYYLN